MTVCKNDFGTPITLVMIAEHREVQRKVENIRTPPNASSVMYKIMKVMLDSVSWEVAGENSPRTIENNKNIGNVLKAFKYNICRVLILFTSESFCTRVKYPAYNNI